MIIHRDDKAIISMCHLLCYCYELLTFGIITFYFACCCKPTFLISICFVTSEQSVVRVPAQHLLHSRERILREVLILWHAR